MIIEIKYPVKINYNPESDKPSRVFTSLGKTIDTFYKLDTILANSIGDKIQVKQTLDHIELGSITTWLKSLIEIPDDDSLRAKKYNEKKVKEYFDKSRNQILSKYEGDYDLESAETYQKVEREVRQIAEETGILNEFTWNSPEALRVAEVFDDLSKSFSLLNETDEVQIGEQSRKIMMPKGKVINLVQMQESLVHHKNTNDTKEKLIIKKADFLGESKWDFRVGNRRVEAKIVDENWMRLLHNREIRLTTGDSLLVILRTELGFDKNRRLVTEKHEIIKVLKLENSSDMLQDNLPL
ncbi:conserved hypothetical protein [Leptospira interrogans serovar Manilae]|uniref:Uncharacterized protein n=1 Tax=Leptospira interrogans serovar Manilae TaxID=214675 RepID=A0AAQ1NYI6_LEPIR|nr:hypothetical protein [Leptospira interrogans]AKP25237.1 hypothetical protein LIMLP_04225 [Leptospira interrogans serovar Manilae]AKP29020.1 hypothetical protein LIMHP_04210 [Leptospira interrogans serovar Manilae]EYU62243.1 hypothetical protein CI00_00705 [Leptospira interrogans serovar Manilae]SOR61635.1 conserved hypothetical protein [Leptospira interrogans serovar Manilae]